MGKFIVNGAVQELNASQLAFLKEIGVVYTPAPDTNEGYIVLRKGTLSFRANEEQKLRHAAMPLFKVFKITDMKYVRYKWGSTNHFKYSFEEPTEGYSTYGIWLSSIFPTREDAERSVKWNEEDTAASKEIEDTYAREIDAARQKRAMALKAWEEKKGPRPKPISPDKVPHFKSDMPENQWGDRYIQWKEKTGGRETLTLVS